MADEVLVRPVCQHCPPVVAVGGERWRQYVVDYWYDGRYSSVAIYARTWQEAEARVKALKHAKVEGAVHDIIHVNKTTVPFVKPLMDLWCWLHNKLSPPSRSSGTSADPKK